MGVIEWVVLLYVAGMAGQSEWTRWTDAPQMGVSDRVLQESFSLAAPDEARQVKVRARDGRLLLAGVVASEAAHKRLVRFALSFPGCIGVVDAVTVKDAPQLSESLRPR